MDDSLSISLSLNKIDETENMSLVQASIDDAASRIKDEVRPAAISNEQIVNGDEILQTYEVTSDAVSGGMGSVWRVHHKSWDTDLAMKRPQPRFFAEGSDARKAEFIKECENWIDLGMHPNIVSCYFVRDVSGVPTIFSEWMDGGSLKDRIRDGSLYEGTEDEVQERILDIAIQAARGLEYSHRAGLIHQDVKPGNLLLSREWDAKAADFGLAKAQKSLEEGTDTAQASSSGYTPEYAPKEQADGETAQPWMDVYAWALTVLEMYAGKRLWKSGADAPEHLQEYCAACERKIPEGLTDLLSRCILRRDISFTEAAAKLEEIYYSACGIHYFRTMPQTVEDTSYTLNNRALSFLDLGQPAKADILFRKAMDAGSHSEDPYYNYDLLSWRRGDFSDEDAVRFIDNHMQESSELKEVIYRESGIPAVDYISPIEEEKPKSVCWDRSTDSIYWPAVTDEITEKTADFITRKTIRRLVRSPDTKHILVTTEDKELFLLVYKEDEDCWKERYLLETEGGFIDWFFITGDRICLKDGEKIFVLRLNDSADTILKNIIHTARSGMRTIYEPTAVIERQLPDTFRPAVSDGKITGISFEDQKAVFYDDQLQPFSPGFSISAKDLPHGIGEYAELFVSDRYLFIADFTYLDAVSLEDGTAVTVLAAGEDEEFSDAVLRAGSLYVLGADEIFIIDGTDLSKSRLRHHKEKYERMAFTPDGKYLLIAGMHDFEKEYAVWAYSLEEQRCILTKRFRSKGELFDICFASPTSDKGFSLIYLDVLNDYDGYRGRHVFLNIERYGLPETGERAGWHLSKIRSVKESIETVREFENILQEAQRNYESGDISTCLEQLEKGYALKGFEENEHLRRLNQKAGQGRTVEAVRYIRKYENKGMRTESPIALIGTDRILSRTDEAGYRLYSWETGEQFFPFPAGKDSVFLCVSCDHSAAFAAEGIMQDRFTLHRMDLTDGSSSRRQINAHIEPAQIQAAADSGRMILVSERKTLISIQEGSEPLITEGRLYAPVFTADGKYVIASDIQEMYGTGSGLYVYPADAFFERDTEPKPSAGAQIYAIKQITVSNDNVVMAVTDRGNADLAYMQEGRYDMFCLVGKWDTEFSFPVPDGSGFLAVAKEGGTALFMPREKGDYILKAREPGDEMPREGFTYTEVPEKYIRYTETGPVLKNDAPLTGSYVSMNARQTYYPAEKPASGNNYCANSNGTAFLDGKNHLWAVDYKYFAEPSEGFRTWKAVTGKKKKKGIFLKLFGSRS